MNGIVGGVGLRALVAMAALGYRSTQTEACMQDIVLGESPEPIP